MLNLIKIDDLADPRMDAYRTSRERIPKGEDIIVDSEKVVARAIASGIQIRSILGTNHYFAKHEGMFAKLDCIFYVADQQLMQGIVGHRLHQGIMAIAKRPDDTPLMELGSRIVALDRVLDVQNVGSIVRSSHAFGIDSIIIGAEGCSPFGRRSIRVSMGSIFNIKVYHSEDLAADLSILKESGFQIIGAANRENAVALPRVRYNDRSVMIIGNEHAGMSAGVQELCDLSVKIPVSNSIDSLNAACAASVILYSWSQNPLATVGQYSPS